MHSARGALAGVLVLALGGSDRGRTAAAEAGVDADALRQAYFPPAKPWPAFPMADAKATIDAATRRPIRTRVGGGADATTVLKGGGRRATAAWTAIDAWIGERVKASNAAGRSHWVLWGTRHDSAAPIDAFRRLLSPTSSVEWTRAAVEQIRADGYWTGIDQGVQKGDDASISLWQLNGARSGIDELVESQKRDDYAAWKLGYVESVVDLVVAARAMNRPVAGCDMPVALQKWATADADTMLRLRELHCALATKRHLERMKPPHRIAVLWGENHVGPEGFMRFLDPDIDVTAVRVATKADGFEVIDPILVPPATPDDEALVVLADPNAARHLDRIRVQETAEAGVTLASSKPIEIRIDGRAVSVTKTPRPEKLEPGDHVLAVPRGDKTLLAALAIAKDQRVSVQIEQTEPEVTLTYAPAK